MGQNFLPLPPSPRTRPPPTTVYSFISARKLKKRKEKEKIGKNSEFLNFVMRAKIQMEITQARRNITDFPIRQLFQKRTAVSLIPNSIHNFGGQTFYSNLKIAFLTSLEISIVHNKRYRPDFSKFLYAINLRWVKENFLKILLGCIAD